MMLGEIEDFIRVHGIKQTRFGLESIKDGNLVEHLRMGRKLTPPTEQRIREYMARKNEELEYERR
jgi:hypothetical protein